MFPSATSNSVAHGCVRHAVASGKLGLREPARVVQASGFAYRFWRQLRLLLPSAKLSTFPTLVNHVFKVLALSTKKEMVRVHARGIVAAVKDAHAVRYCTVHLHPEKAVSGPVVELAIARMVTGAGPIPAGVGLVYMRPEAGDLLTRATGFSAFRIARDYEELRAWFRQATTGARFNLRQIAQASHLFFASDAFRPLRARRIAFGAPKGRCGFNRLTARTFFFGYDMVSHDVNLLDRFTKWLGLFGCVSTRAGRFYFSTVNP
jgi:hypothetical protein